MTKQFNKKESPFRWILSYTFCLMLMLCISPAKAAVNNYTFAYSAGTYTPIAGTTLFSGTWDDSNSGLLTIPFTFSYNGNNYTTLGVSSNGFITLGALTSTVYCGLQTSAPNSISGFGTDLNANAGSTVQYATTGVSPNRQFVIQWTDCKHFFQTTDHYTFQIILNETSNEVQVVWGPVTAVTTTGANNCQDVATESGNIGLKGSSNADFNIRSVTNGTNTWPTSVNGGVLSAVCNMSSTNFPASGLTYTWTPPVPSPMVFASCTTVLLNNGEVDGQGSNSHQTLQVQVVTTGNLSPIDVTSLVLSTAGSTNPGVDISNAKVYFTGLSGTYSAATQFGSTTSFPNGTYTLNGTATLSEGTNYFWVDYSIAAGATIGNTLTGCCTQITGNGTMGVQVPTVTCPAGSHIVGPPLGFWTPVANAAPSASGGVALVLSDGTVMCKSSAGGGGIGNVWNKLTPNANGSYANGTWTTLAPMISTRLYFSSQVLKDGRVYVAGGEYGTGLQQAETYNPLTNVWTAAPSPGVNISDANSEILEDGRILQACVTGNLKVCKIYDPITNTYIVGPSSLGIHNESAWVKLPDNSILMVDRLATTSERYIPSLNLWVADGTVPVALYDPFGDETGGALLLPDGRAFFIGSLGHNAYYTPSGNNTPGTWAAAPDIPGGLGVPDGAAAIMVNGKILLACSPIPTSGNHFPPPTSFFEFDYLSNTFTLINTPFGGTTTNMSCYITNMTALPDGNILYSTQGSSQYYLYTPGTAQLAAGKPIIGSITQTSCTAFSIDGTQFNGISQGGTYGDDWQMATNYPIIRLTNGSNVYYCRTFNWNSTGVQRGLQPDNVQFTLPAGLPVATYSLVVTANGIASDPVSFTPVPYLTSTLTPSAVCSNTSFNYTPVIAPGTATFTWTRAAVAGISNSAVVIPQNTNPNETLINTTASPVSVVYDFIVTSNGCSNTQQVTVLVNPSPAPVITGNSSFCAGSSITLDAGAGYTGYSWSTGATSQTISVSTAGNVSVTVTNASNCTGSASVTTVVNPLPNVTASNVSGCAGSTIALAGSPAGGTWSVANPYSGASTTYTHTFTDGNGCTNTSASANITVNARPTGVLSGTTTICGVGSTSLSIAATGSGTISGTINPGAIAYSGTAPIITVSVSPGGLTNYSIATMSDANCSSIAGDLTGGATVSVYTLSTAPTSITSNAVNNQICTGNSILLTANGGAFGNAPGASYKWYEGGCGTGAALGSAATLSLTPTLGSHTYYARIEDACGNTNCTSLTVLVTAATQLSQIQYTASIADGCVGAPSATFSVNPVAGCTFYNWTSAQSGVRFNGNPGPYQTTVPTVNITFVSLPAAGASGWNICVFGGNPCGITNTRCAWVRSSVSAPTAIIGSVIGCPGTSGNNYSSSGVAGAASYQWSSTGGIVVTGNGSQAVTVSFPGGFVSGTLSVRGQTTCGYQGPNRTITITANPAIPGTISGTSYPCPNASASYSIAAVPGATNYQWTTSVPGAVVTGTTTSCSIAFPTTIPAGSTVSVVAKSSCPTSSPVRSKGIASGLPGAPQAISGPASGQCGQTGVSYTINPVFGATAYNWTASCGTIVGSNNLSGVTIDWSSSFTTCTLTVAATNSCGSGIARTMVVFGIPAIPASISGTTVPCANALVTYSASSVGATSYNWTVPAGATILGPANGPSINVLWGATSGNITVTASNTCGTSGVRSLPCVISCRQSQVTGSASAFNAEVYPNPATEKAIVKFSATTAAQYNLSMTDVIGRNVLSTDGTATEGINMIDLDLNNLAKGVYMLNIMSGENTEQIRVVVE